MTKTEFIKKVAADTGAPYVHCEKWTNAVRDSMADALVTEDVLKLRGVGIFEHVARKARKGRNASTGEIIVIPARTGIKYTPSDAIAEEIKDIPVAMG